MPARRRMRCGSRGGMPKRCRRTMTHCASSGRTRARANRSRSSGGFGSTGRLSWLRLAPHPTASAACRWGRAAGLRCVGESRCPTCTGSSTTYPASRSSRCGFSTGRGRTRRSRPSTRRSTPPPPPASGIRSRKPAASRSPETCTRCCRIFPIPPLRTGRCWPR